ncbi:hypothetical protein [Endozoicomonas sp. G2_1]|nr:hypothetical protein [Endozoicomonas sp. G2_1]
MATKNASVNQSLQFGEFCVSQHWQQFSVVASVLLDFSAKVAM